MRKAITCVLIAMLPACTDVLEDELGEDLDGDSEAEVSAVVVGPLSATPDPLQFPQALVGDTPCGTSGSKSCTYATVTLANSGKVNQTITTASATGVFWVTWGGTCNNTTNKKVVRAGSSCTLQFGFAPAKQNTAYKGTGSITFASGTVLKIGLRGSAGASLTSTPDPLVFPNATFGGTPCGSPGGTACTYGMITINNNLSTAQTITTASGATPFWVTWGGTCNSVALNKTVPAHGSCTLQWGFAPTAAGTIFNGAGSVSFASGLGLNVKLKGTSN